MFSVTTAKAQGQMKFAQRPSQRYFDQHHAAQLQANESTTASGVTLLTWSGTFQRIIDRKCGRSIMFSALDGIEHQ